MLFGYLILLLAIISENIGTTALKGSKGLSRPLFVVGAILGYSLNFLLLGQALARIPLAIAYGVWSGVGMALVTLLGVVIWERPLIGEPRLGSVLYLPVFLC